ncbi:MAG: hypothetical protein GY765_32935 [bacterium]|nr:hypothetical protein [bacterium]
MKRKVNISKKLQLKKTTVASLTGSAIISVKGGLASWPPNTCECVASSPKMCPTAYVFTDACQISYDNYTCPANWSPADANGTTNCIFGRPNV